ncbi:paraquat-inducible protein A [Neomegalonema perideroedes]|uniref:paraquat-inducible protein A n=1 Tax=Neomegalonema perideroedes TaxID=217219 RepID=UPI0012FE6D37|nr:paraquat-inducible protein A [Neomegalonema perideroedes]
MRKGAPESMTAENGSLAASPPPASTSSRAAPLGEGKALGEAWSWGGDLAACPSCDLLHRVPDLAVGEKALCARCGALTAARRPQVFERLLAVALANMVLMGAALWFPFVMMSRSGFGREIRILDAPFALAEGPTAFIALTVMANIALIPFLRSLAVAYVAAPMVFGSAPPARSAEALRLWSFLRPWSMAEIFMLGVAVSAIKLGSMARVSLGPGFWAFAALLPTLAFENMIFHSPSIWREIRLRRRRVEAAARLARRRGRGRPAQKGSA